MPKLFNTCLLAFLVLFAMPHSVSANPFSSQAYKAKETHGAVKLRVLGDGAQRVYLFIPDNPSPQDTAPVVLFHHGWQMMNPMNFGALIDHLVRTGHVVIYPVFQESVDTPLTHIMDNSVSANRWALDVLKEEYGLSPAKGQTLYFGFSIGAAVSVNLAIDAEKYQLPPANAMVLFSPGDAGHIPQGLGLPSFYQRLEQLPHALPIVIMTGEDDDIGLPTARMLAKRLCHIPREHRILYVLPTSSHGQRKINAGHGSPGAPDSRYNFPVDRKQFPKVLQGLHQYERSASLNQLDFFGYWKMMDGVVLGLKTGEFPAWVFGFGDPEQLSLGHWDDGTALLPMRIENYCP